MAGGTAVSGLRKRVADTWGSIKQRRPGIAHAVRGYHAYRDNHGDHLAAAITYFSFLALFPLILLGASIAGYVLAAHSSWSADLYRSVRENVPGSFGDTINSTIRTAISNRAGVGVIGLFGFLLTGLGWIANLRTAIDTVWGLPQAKRSFLKAKLSDLSVLVGLGTAMAVSLAVTAGGTAASGAFLRWTSLDAIPGASTLTVLLGLLFGLLGDTLIFGWLLIRLPDVEVARRTAVRATLLAAFGFELLKIVGAFYIARATRSPAVALIAPVLGILIWIDLVARYLLYCVSWAASAEPESRPEQLVAEIEPQPTQSGERERQPAPPISPIGVAAALVTSGAAVGGAVVVALQHRRRSRASRQ